MPLNNTQMLTMPKSMFSAHIYGPTPDSQTPPTAPLMSPFECLKGISPTAVPPQPPPVREFPSVQVLGPKPHITLDTSSSLLLLSPVSLLSASPDICLYRLQHPPPPSVHHPSALCPLLHPCYHHNWLDSAIAVAGQECGGHRLPWPGPAHGPSPSAKSSPSRGHRLFPTPCASGGATHPIPRGLQGGTHRPGHRSTERWPRGGHLSPGSHKREATSPRWSE